MPSLALLVVFALSFVPLVLSAVQTVNVAALFSLTYQGQPDSSGLSRYTGFLAAVEDINNNPTYNGVMVLNATSYDTQRISSRAATFTQQALSESSVAIVTVVTTPETQASINVSGSLPNVAAGANSAIFSDSAAYPYFIRDIPNGADQTTCMAYIINNNGAGLKSATVYTANDAATNPIAQALLSKITSTSLPVQSGIPVPNATAAANFLENSGATIWPIISQTNDIAVILAALNASGPLPPYIIPSVDSALSSSLFTTAATQAVAQNMFACTLSSANTTAYQTFLTSYNRVAPSTNVASLPLDSKASYSYDLAVMIAEAALSVINANGNVSDNTQLMAALRRVNFAGASGQISFNAGSNDIAEKKTYVVKRVAGQSFNQVGIFGADGVFQRTDATFIFPAAPAATTTTTTSGAATITTTGTTGTTPTTTTTTTSSSSSTGTTTTSSSASSLLLSLSSLVVLASFALFL